VISSAGYEQRLSKFWQFEACIKPRSPNYRREFASRLGRELDAVVLKFAPQFGEISMMPLCCLKQARRVPR